MSDFVFSLPVSGMDGNKYCHPLDVSREYLATLTNNLVILKHFYKGYSANNFGNASPKEGETFLVRLPNRYKMFDGWDITQYNTVQEHVVPITMDMATHIPLEISDNDLTLYINDFAKLFLEPAALQAANDLDFMAAGSYKQVYHQVGTPGTTPSDLLTFLQSGMVLDYNSVPRDGKRWGIIDPVTNMYLVDALKGLYNPSQIISGQYVEGTMNNASGLKFQMSQNLQLHTNGLFEPVAGQTIKLKFAITEGASQVVMYNFASATPTVNEGDIFTIAGIYEVNMMNKQNTGLVQQFVATSDGVWNGVSETMTVDVSPVIKADPADPYQNVTSLGVVDAAIYFSGDSEQIYPINLVFHESAFCFVSANLNIPGGVDYAASETIEGINTRIARQWSIGNSKYVTKLDMLFGKPKCIRPEMAVRIAG